MRIQRLALGNAGDVRPVGGGVSELRQRGALVVLLVCGGDNSSQAADIAKAHAMAERLED